VNQQTPTTDQQRKRQRKQLRDKLSKEQQTLARWMTRLKRTFHAFEKAQQRVTRLERQLAKLNTP